MEKRNSMLQSMLFGGGSGGGGGGGSGGGVLYVNAVYDEQTDKITLDKTYAEITSAVKDNKFVAIKLIFESESGDEIQVGYFNFAHLDPLDGFIVTFFIPTNAGYFDSLWEFASPTEDGILTKL